MMEIFVRWLHFTAAVTWIGGMIFFPLVLIPALKIIDPPPKRMELISAVGKRLRVVGWICIGILLFTGVTMLISHPRYVEGLTAIGSNPALGIKLALVAVMVGFSFLHDFVLGPKVARHPGNPGLSRKIVIMIARVNLLIGLAVIAFGAILGAQ
jgi:uncharacterized membrane protein